MGDKHTDLQQRLIGAWTLESWSIQFSDGSAERFPFGLSPCGSLMYSSNGRMLAAIGRADRTLLSTAVPQQAPVVEKVAAFDSFFSYGGSFYIEGDTVVHQVDIALNPNFVGSVQKRRMEFVGEHLTLSADEGRRHHRLVWRRVAVP